MLFLKDSDHMNKFERNQTDVFKMDLPDLGEISKIQIGHDGGGPGAGWYLEKVFIRATDNDQEMWVALASRWLDKGKEDGKIEIELPCSKQQGMRSYEVQVLTGDVRFAGTDANVRCMLIGNKGASSPLYLQRSNNMNKFERAQTDVFHFDLPHLGDLELCRIGHDGAGVGAGWHLESVTVIEKESQTQWTFKASRWLDRDKEDGALEIELTVAEKVAGAAGGGRLRPRILPMLGSEAATRKIQNQSRILPSKPLFDLDEEFEPVVASGLAEKLMQRLNIIPKTRRKRKTDDMIEARQAKIVSMFVSYDIRETKGDWADGVYESVPTKLMSQRDGPIQFLNMGKHRQLCLLVVGEDCTPTGCAGVFMGQHRLAKEYPVDIAERRQLWAECMSVHMHLNKAGFHVWEPVVLQHISVQGELVELHTLNVSKGFNRNEMTVIADWPEYDKYALPKTDLNDLLLVPFSLFLNFDVSQHVFQVKALLAVKIFASHEIKSDERVKRLWEAQSALANVLPQAFYKITDAASEPIPSAVADEEPAHDIDDGEGRE
jgi:hypothetical protein